jgi:hypothetical protein
MPWQKQADGTWKQLATSTTHQENTYYEDKFVGPEDIIIDVGHWQGAAPIEK